MKRVGIIVVAYNAASTLAAVLDRIPRDYVGRIDQVLVADDHSQDSTYLVGLGYQRTVSDLPLTVVRHAENLGYGGNQMACYRWAIEHGLDIVVLLHGDGQYAPELLPALVEPLDLDKCDAVLGSRMMEPGAARRGGMPLYKYAGNRVLSTVQNAVVGTSLSEWHSGYRAYRVDALRDIPFESNSAGFDFDTQIILQLLEAGKRIDEVPISTYYGDEVCYVNGIGYAFDVTRAVMRYRAQKMGFGSGDLAFASGEYDRKLEPGTSHGRLLSWLEARRPSRVLDLGCADGALGEQLRTFGHEVTGVDLEEQPGVAARLNRFVQADLEAGLPGEVGDGYAVVLAADVLEHVRSPGALLADAAARLAPGGSVVTSVPNFAHWYPRLRVALGRFDYDRRGILDRGHLRFFTRRSFERLVRAQHLTVRRRDAVGLPFEVVERGAVTPGRHRLRLLKRAEQSLVALWPTLFAYQFLYELSPEPA